MNERSFTSLVITPRIGKK